MSRIDELIEKLCPDGVEYRPIKTIYERLKGTAITARKMKEIADPCGEIRIFAGGRTMIHAHEKEIPKANITRVPAVLIQSRGIIDCIYCEQPFTFKNEMWAYASVDKVSVKFLFYVLKANIDLFRNEASGMGSMPQISLKVTDEFRAPVPPMEVQEEIVRVLDSFAELEAELEARHRQFDYYRNCILSGSAEGEKTVPLSKVGTFTGSTPKKSQQQYFGDEHPFYKPGDFNNGESISTSEEGLTDEGLRASRLVSADSTMVVCIGATIGKVGYAQKKGSCNQQINAILPSADFNPRYVFHLANSRIVQDQIARLGSFSSMPILSLKKFNQIQIPLPPRELQDRVAEALDQFDALVNDISQGIPAEMEARRKQYAYYRDKLLAFKEKDAVA